MNAVPKKSFNSRLLSAAVYCLLSTAAVTEMIVDLQGVRAQRTVFGVKEIRESI